MSQSPYVYDGKNRPASQTGYPINDPSATTTTSSLNGYGQVTGYTQYQPVQQQQQRQQQQQQQQQGQARNSYGYSAGYYDPSAQTQQSFGLPQQQQYTQNIYQPQQQQHQHQQQFPQSTAGPYGQTASYISSHYQPMPVTASTYGGTPTTAPATSATNTATSAGTSGSSNTYGYPTYQAASSTIVGDANSGYKLAQPPITTSMPLNAQSSGRVSAPLQSQATTAHLLDPNQLPQRPKLTTSFWEDENTVCYQVESRGISVSRREDTNFINGTKLLNVAGMTRGRRDGILKSEKVRYVVKIGAMNLKGVWIPFERALELARNEGIVDLLYPLFVKDIKELYQGPQFSGGLTAAANSNPKNIIPVTVTNSAYSSLDAKGGKKIVDGTSLAGVTNDLQQQQQQHQQVPHAQQQQQQVPHAQQQYYGYPYQYQTANVGPDQQQYAIPQQQSSLQQYKQTGAGSAPAATGGYYAYQQPPISGAINDAKDELKAEGDDKTN